MKIRGRVKIKTERAKPETSKKTDRQTDDYGSADRLEKIVSNQACFNLYPIPFLVSINPTKPCSSIFLRKRATLTKSIFPICCRMTWSSSTSKILCIHSSFTLIQTIKTLIKNLWISISTIWLSVFQIQIRKQKLNRE